MTGTAITDTALNKDNGSNGHRSIGTGNPPWGRVSCSFRAAKVREMEV